MADSAVNGPYRVIYADPPWAWTKGKFVDRGAARTVEKEYQTMQPEEIKALPIAKLVADDAVLLLWATGPKLPLAFEVMQAWGFTYRTVAFTWIKQNRKAESLPQDAELESEDGLFFGMGFYTRANTEFCLVGTRGKGVKRKSASVRQVIVAPVAQHSAKPEEAAKRIEALYDGPYLELFARAARSGWDVWGNQAPGSISIPT